MAVKRVKKNRLYKIEVRETSLVGTPANNHPFYIAKDAGDDAVETDTAQTGEDDTSMKLPTGSKDAMVKSANDALLELMELCNGLVNALESEEQEEHVGPGTFVDSINKIGGHLTKMMKSYGGSIVQVSSPAASQEATTMKNEPVSKDEGLARLDRFDNAMKVVGALVENLSKSKVEVVKSVPKPAVVAPVAPAVPAVSASTLANLSELTKSLTDLKKNYESLAKEHEELKKASRRVPVSNVIQPEPATNRTSAGDSVVWEKDIGEKR